MWRTALGNRILRGAEWELFREALVETWELVEDAFGDDDGFDSGVHVFDSLQPGQKLAMLALVGQALHDQTTTAPELTALTEGTVAAVFAILRVLIEVETVTADDLDLVDENPLVWRERVLAAWRQVEGTGDGFAADSSCDDLSEWEILFDSLSERILWDNDYDLAEEFLDADPEAARVQMEQMRIAPNYFLAIAHDPTEGELADIRRTLRELTGRPDTEKLTPGFEDAYHGLLVGPCDQEAIDRECRCRLIEETCLSEEGGFDCSYQEWVRLFREKVLQTAAQDPEDAAESGIRLTKEQQAKAWMAKQSGSALELANGHRIEPRAGSWIVVDGRGFALVDVEHCAWAAEDGDDDLPAIEFEDPEQALVAFLRSEAIASIRSERYDLAMTKLGRR